MELLISNRSEKPIYQQITDQIKSQIMSGKLKEGEPLPSMRGLAKSLKVSVITAQRAYEDLQKDGFIDTVAGKGSFVAVKNKELYREEQLRKIENKLDEVVQLAKNSDIKLEELHQILSIIYEEEI